MLKSFATELLTEGLLARTDGVVVGVSGGPDSMALLHLLVGLNEKLDWSLRIHIAHLNHHLRGLEAEKDAAFVQGAADSLGLPCTIDQRDIGALAREEDGGIEEVARRERLAMFQRVCLKTESKVIALAHHADDNAETILHRIFRGTGLRGLAGIPQRRPFALGSDLWIIRPLLGRSRQALQAYLANEGIACREDRTNAGVEAMRNRIRNVVLPVVEEQVNPQVRDALTRLGEQARWLGEFLGETVQRTFETLIISRNDQELILNVDALARKSRIVQTEIVRLGYIAFDLGEQDLSFSHLASALDLIAGTAGGKQIKLPGGMTVEKRYHQLVFSLPSDVPREDISSEIAIHVPGRTMLPIRRLEIDCAIEHVGHGDIPRLRKAASSMEEYVNMDAVQPPLVVRGRRPGDRFIPLGAPGSKKISDFLADNKVAPKHRDRVAVLCDHLGPIWIIGHRIDDRVKLTALSRRVLHLKARPLDP
jgi:tRNA(Ile)-lysidine synthase